MAAALTFAGAVSAEAADTSCTSGVCTVTFAYSGAAEQWVVPSGVTSVTATISAGSGGASGANNYMFHPVETGAGGLGGSMRATLDVEPGEKLTAVVGGAGQDGVANSSTPAAGGFGGGASAGAKPNARMHSSGGGGGGGSFLFGSGSLLLATGGGGGGSSADYQAVTGGAGGSTGAGDPGHAPRNASSWVYSGGGATSSRPGNGGFGDYPGGAGSSSPASSSTTFGEGGAGAGNPSGDDYGTGGGGGGGFYGGGGGGADTSGESTGSGGGGSGFVASTATNFGALNGNSGNGRIVMTYADPSYATNVTVKASDNPNDATATALTATVSPATATGSVSFFDGETALGSATLTSGTATLSKLLSAGTHTITASYSGDSSHNPNDASTTVTVAAYTAPSFGTDSSMAEPIEKSAVAGEPFSFTLKAAGTPTPTYTVKNDDDDETVLPDGVTFADGVLSGTSTLAGSWQISVTATNSLGTDTEHVRLTVAPGTATGLKATVTPGDTNSTTTWAVAPDGSVTESSDGTTTDNATITADQGETIVFQTVPVDRYGNTVTTDAVQPVTLSSVDSDTITYDSETNLTTVKFNHASPHVISFTADGVSNSFTVQVTPTTETPAFGTASTSDAPIVKTVIAGDSFSFTDLAATGLPTPTYTVENDDTDSTVLPDGVSFTDGVLAGSSTRAGTWKIKVTATNSVGTATGYLKLTIAPGPATALEALVSPGDSSSTTLWVVAPDGTVATTITANQGDSIVFDTMPVDQYGNPTTSGNVQPVTTSSVDTDTITYDPATNLTTVTFNHASPHTITFTVGGLTNSFTVQVTPTPSTGTGTDTGTGTGTGTGTSTGTPASSSSSTAASSHLATTGSAPLAPLGWALGILAIGVAVMLLQRHRTARRPN